MYCPQCKAEYRSGFTSCPDCNVGLVENLPEAGDGSNAELRDEDLKEVWAGDDEGECISICEQFQEAQIPYKVNQRHHLVFKRVDSSFRIGVPPNFYERANEIIEKDAEQRGQNEEAMELTAKDDAVTAPDLDHDDWDPDNWQPEDATVEVFSENIEQATWMIEASLRENNINSRTDVLDDGSRKVFVLPKDEARAREIVHEIKDATPPQ